VRRSGRIMNRQDRDRGAEMRLTERTRKLIPETKARRTERTGFSVEESVRMTEDRGKWRKYVHGVANPRIEEG